MFVPKIPSMRIMDLAKVVAPEATCRIVGIRPGEKIHECLITKEEGRHAYEMKDRYVVLSASSLGWSNDVKKYRGAKKVKDEFEYHSHTNTHYLNHGDMRKLLKEVE